MNLKPIESRILRSFGKPGRELAAVSSLLQKGLLTVAGAHVELTEAGRAWIAEDTERIRKAHSKGGKRGGKARAESLTKEERIRIAKLARSHSSANVKTP